MVMFILVDMFFFNVYRCICVRASIGLFVFVCICLIMFVYVFSTVSMVDQSSFFLWVTNRA